VLASEETQALLQQAAAGNTAGKADGVLTALLAALVVAGREWTGSDGLWLALEGHGRGPADGPLDALLFDGIELSRSVGWFTSLYPAWLSLPAPGDLREPSRAVSLVRDQLARVPQRGLTYGLLRYGADPGIKSALAAVPMPELAFNYLGQVRGTDAFARVLPSPSRDRGGDSQRPFLIEINALVRNQSLIVEWTYNRRWHQRETIASLADRHLAALRAILRDAGGRRAPASSGESDFDDAGLTPAEIAALLDEIG
jgi:non-ribosomal peptide synthase protein (TIGR01720 family)